MNAKYFLTLLFVFCNAEAKSTTNVQSTTPSNLATTNKPVDPYPCPGRIAVAYDKSNGLTANEYKTEKDILIKHVFKNWTSVEELRLYPYAADAVRTGTFKNVDEVIDYIQKDEQVDEEPSLCDVLVYASYQNNVVIFVSHFNTTDSKKCTAPDNWGVLYVFITFVALTENVQIDALRDLVPLAQIINWNANTNKMPENWQWSIDTAYRCNINDNGGDKTAYPCDRKIVIAYDESNDISLDALKTQKDFLLNNVFTGEWNVFRNLALIAYSKTTRIGNFGTMNKLDDIHNFVNQDSKVDEPGSLCQLFDILKTMYIRDVYVVLFVNEFHTSTETDCNQSIKQLRENFESITFVNYTAQVDIEYLLSVFPQANFISWPISERKIPEEWNSKFQTIFGCDNYNINNHEYPCQSNLNIVYDKSHYLKPLAFQRLTNFLLKRLFIGKWSGDVVSSLFNYADTVSVKDITGTVDTHFFVRESLRVEKEPLFCNVVNSLLDDNDGDYGYVIFFVSKFDNETTPEADKSCLKYMKRIRRDSKNITFFKLGPLVNESHILEFSPGSAIVSWDIEHEAELKNWNQVLWEAFGCLGDSPIILPTTPSPTVITTTTTQLTSTTTMIVPKNTTTSLTFTSSLSTKGAITISQTIKTSSHPPKRSNTKVIILVSIFVPLFIVFVLSVITCFCLNKRKTRNQFINNLAFKGTDRKNYYKKRSQVEDLWITEAELFIDRKLGSGAFANVYLGKLIGCAGIKRVYPDLAALSHFENSEVAVKLLPLHATEANKKDFEQEINFMKNLKHHFHIVTLLGYNYGQIILEYCANGDLLNFLKQKRGNFDSTRELKLLISFAWQVADGMQYFASLNLIHRDLAARNILLTEDCNCKIGDFGLARQGNMHFYTSNGGKIPVRWSPMEVLKSFEYSMKSDVWSYAVLLYELFTLGELPYFGRENSEIFSYLEDGNRLERPEHAPDEVYDLMSSCWSTSPDERPTFTDICQKLTPFLEQQTMHYNYVDAIEQALNEINVLDSDEVAI